jgi:hypothetical protein
LKRVASFWPAFFSLQWEKQKTKENKTSICYIA